MKSHHYKDEEKVRRLLKLKPREVSIVDSPAIQREFLVIKNAEEGTVVDSETESAVEQTETSSESSCSEPVGEVFCYAEVDKGSIPDQFTKALSFVNPILAKVSEQAEGENKESAQLVHGFLSKLESGYFPSFEPVAKKQHSEKAVWSTAYVNDLPDSAFLWVAPGGEKDEDGKTVPRSLRYFPVKDKDGKVDPPHLRNAIARIPQAKHPELTKEVKDRLQEKARMMLEDLKEDVEKAYRFTPSRVGTLKTVLTQLFDVLKEVDPSAESLFVEVQKKAEVKDEEVTDMEDKEVEKKEEAVQEQPEETSVAPQAESDEEVKAESVEKAEDPVEEVKAEETEEVAKEEPKDANEPPSWLADFKKDLLEEVSKRVEEVAKQVTPLKEITEKVESRVASIEKARTPSASLEAEGQTESVEKSKDKGLWSSLKL